MMRDLGRREFLKRLSLTAPLALGASACAWGTNRNSAHHAQELHADLVIIGGGLGGCAAALSALTAGIPVILTEETDWIGGQLTSQAVPPDENQWIETIGGTRRYRSLRTAIRRYYTNNTPLIDRARNNPLLNPGSCWVSRLGCEPTVALAVLQEQLSPFIRSGQLRLLLQHRPAAAQVHGDRVRAVSVVSGVTGAATWLSAPYFADATELGDLLSLTSTEYVTGAESAAMTGEPHAKAETQPDNEQAFTVCFAIDYRPGENHVITRPDGYAQWRDQELPDALGKPYRLLSFDEPANAKIGFDPEARTGYWSYRRVIDRDLFQQRAETNARFGSDVTIVNWGLNDYSFGSLTAGTAQEAARHIVAAKQQSLSLLYWLQTEAPRKSSQTGWPGLRLRPDIMGTTDGFAKTPYIRESRRIQAEFTVLEHHVTTEARAPLVKTSGEPLTALPYRDSVGIGHYSMDLHRTTRGDYGRYGATLPFQIPLGALIPQRMENLLPACRNLGVTHLTNGCYRLHPVEWNIGESIGQLVAFCLDRRVVPRQVRASTALLADFQKELLRTGVPIAWPTSLPK